MRVAACKGQLPFDVAFLAEDAFVLAWCVAQGENNGGKFHWETLSWEERR